MTTATTFNSALTTNYANGVAGLVDADMNTASTRLQALQTQEQLGIQSLSVANQNAALILKLFGADAKFSRAPLALPPGKCFKMARGETRQRSPENEKPGPRSRRPGVFRNTLSFLDAVTEEALGVDRVEPQTLLQFLAQLADVALDHVLVDVFVEKSVNGVEDLRLADAPAAAAEQKFEYAPLPARKREGLAVHLGLAPVEVDAQFADRRHDPFRRIRAG